MLKALRKKIFGREQLPTYRSTGSYRIQDQKQLAALFHLAYENHALFFIFFEDQPNPFTTAVLGVYPEHGFLVLDELAPREGHDLLLQRGEFRATGKVDGVDLRFRSRLIEAREKSGIAFYKVEIPESAFYRQQREEHRVSTSGERIRFRGYRGRAYQQTLNGYLTDLSHTGLGVVLEELAPLYQGETLPTCSIHLPDHGEALFSLKVRFAHQNRQREVTRIGGKFAEIDKESYRKIVRTITRLERERCKRIKER